VHCSAAAVLLRRSASADALFLAVLSYTRILHGCPRSRTPSGCQASAPWDHGPRSTAGPRPHRHHVAPRQPPWLIASCHESHSQQLRPAVPFLQSGPCKTLYFNHLFSVSCTLIKTAPVESCFYTLVLDDIMLTSSPEKFNKISFYISLFSINPC
jgi:hypothetical protein